MARPTDRRGAGRRVSREESELFRAAMRDARASPKPEAPPGQRAATLPSAKPRNADNVPSPPGAPLPELRAGEAAGLDRRTMERLRRGQFRPEARLDLHGLTVDEAHNALIGFLRRARADGRRCVIVITGRGRDSFGGGAIRAEAPRWLNGAALRPLILGFAQAQPKDGGAGALYVLLRRRK